MTTRQDLIDGLQMVIRQGERLMSAFRPEDWKKQTHMEEDGWNRKQVYCHLTAVAEITPNFLPRLAVASEGEDAMGGVDINALNAQLVATKEGLSEPELIANFRTAHEKLIDFIKGVPEEQLQHAAQFGNVRGTVGEIADSVLVLHALAHIYSAGGSAT
jgi:hypothetical protein